jgi:predicted negative regulator of RcsB-dependent stress response/thiol-disulfide isomerase/thioredoxin
MSSVVIVVVAIILSSDVSAAFKYLAEGMTAPAFKGRDLVTGEEIDSNDYRGDSERVFVVAFWATWSERSLELIRDLAAYSRNAEFSEMDILAINVESAHLSPGEKARVEEEFAALDAPFPTIVDDGLEIFASFGVVAVPSTAVLDEKGTLMYGPAGYSYLIRDRIVDSIETWLGVREVSEFEVVEHYVPTNESSRYYNLARQLVARGMVERSVPHLDHAAEADPGFAAVEVLRGEVLMALDDNPAAITAYEKATQMDANLVSAWAGLGTARALANDDAAAELALRKAIELDSSYTPAMVELARCRIRAGDPEEATALLNGVRELVHADPELDFLMGEIRHSQGQVHEALLAYESALQALYPASWDPRVSRR